jgi:hypothetical protein
MTHRLEAISPDTYRDWFLANRSELRHRSPFHEPSWIAAVARGRKGNQLHLGLWDGPELVGALPGFTSGLGPARVFGSPLRGAMTSYMGPIGLDLPDAPQDLLALVEEAIGYLKKRHGLIYARVTLRDTPAETTAESEGSWVHQRPGSYRLDLSGGEDTVWKGLTSDCRRNINKAIGKDVEIGMLDDPDLYYDMLDRTLRRHGSTSSHPPQFFRALFDELGPLLRPLSALHDGQVIAAGLFLMDDKELHYLSGASEPAFGSFPTSYLLHWRAIQEAIENGVGTFNSDASRIRSIDRFKESFRPQFERRHTLIASSPLVYWAQKKLISGYRTYRRTRARVRATG